MSYSLWLHELQHTRLPCPSLSPGVCLNSCPLSQWCHPIISSSVGPLFSWPQSFPASGSFSMSWFFHSGGQRIGASAFTVTESHRNKVAYNEKSKLSVQLWIRMASTGTVQTRVRLPRSLNAHGNCQEGMLRSRRNFLPRSQHKSQSTRNRRGWLAICCTHSSEQR